MTRRVFFLILIWSASLDTGVCIDLKDPGEKKITFQSEVARGISAVDAIPKTLDASKFRDTYWKMFGRNEQQNTDSEGFSLGAGIRMAMRFDEISNDPKTSADSRAFARTFAQGAWNTARIQVLGVLKLDDDQIDQLFGREVLKRMKAKL